MTRPPRQALPWGLIGALGVTQVISWGSLYYAISILGPTIVAEGTLSSAVVYGGFSLSLLVAGLASPAAGRAIDRFGGRPVMAIGSILAAAALALLAVSNSAALFLAASIVAGLATSLTLYNAAFATIVEFGGRRSSDAIAALTLIAGFASTVFWPLTEFLDTRLGWRETYWLYALLQLAVCLPVHALALKPARTAGVSADALQPEPTPAFVEKNASRRLAFALVIVVFSANAFVFSAISVHFVPLLTALGLTAAAAVTVGMLVGPAQVAGRIATIVAGPRLTAPRTGLLSTALLPPALAMLAAGAMPWGSVIFALLYGASNGIITIVNGVLPLALFGRAGYGAMLGAIALPALLARASAPLAFSGILALGGTRGGLALLGAASLVSFAAMITLAILARPARAAEQERDPGG